jgi:hypothetical protein
LQWCADESSPDSGNVTGFGSVTFSDVTVNGKPLGLRVPTTLSPTLSFGFRVTMDYIDGVREPCPYRESHPCR